MERPYNLGNIMLKSYRGDRTGNIDRSIIPVRSRPSSKNYSIALYF
ncbi:MAG: hypothetical protein ACRC2R_21225 [Xenococcaceae cyanobacterium]